MSFFTYQDNILQEAPNFIIFPDGVELWAVNKDNYTYPVNGWYWFDTEAEAKTFYGLE
jgi:hypothetical protein